MSQAAQVRAIRDELAATAAAVNRAAAALQTLTRLPDDWAIEHERRILARDPVARHPLQSRLTREALEERLGSAIKTAAGETAVAADRLAEARLRIDVVTAPARGAPAEQRRQ